MVVASRIFGGDFNLDPGSALVVALVVASVVASVVALGTGSVAGLLVLAAFLTFVFGRLVALVDLAVDALFFLVAMVVVLTFATVVRRWRRVAILLFGLFWFLQI